MDNPDLYKRLAKEIWTIASAPYVVSLKSLHNLLAKTDGRILQRWADQHPCLIYKLGSAVTDALEVWPYAMDMLGSLAKSPVLRDALMTVQPTLLSTLLIRATEKFPADPKVLDICTVFLSKPLHGIPTPASAQTFFIQSFSRAADSPSSLTIRPIYQLLDGGCKDLLATLPPDITSTFQGHLLKIMRGLNAAEDHSLGLLCLGVLAIMVEFSQALHCSQVPPISSNDAQSRSSQETIPATQFAAAQQFFSGAKASKTMHLVVLRVIYACKIHANCSDQEALEVLQLANRALRAVEPSSRKEWVLHNVHIVRKLHEKILKAEVDSGLLLEAFVIVGMLAGGNPLSAEMNNNYNRLLIRLVQLEDHPDPSEQTLGASLGLYAAQLDCDTLAKVLQHTLLLLTRPPESAPEKTRVLRNILWHLTEHAQEDSNVRKGLIIALSTNEVRKLLGQFIRASFTASHCGSQCHTENSCSTAHASFEQDVGLAVCQLLLTAALSAQMDDISMPISTALKLLHKYQQLAKQQVSCSTEVPKLSHEVVNAVPPQRAEDLFHLQTNCNWKESLTTQISLETKGLTDTLVHSVLQVCRRLEERCETAEIPLREEQARCESLISEITCQRVRLAGMEADAARRGVYVDALEADKAILEAQLDKNGAANDDLLQRLENLENELQIANKEAERQIVAAREQYEKNKLELTAALMSKDEILERQSQQHSAMEVELDGLHQALRSAEQLKEELSNGNATYQDRLTEMEASLQLEKDNSSRHAVELEQISNKNAELSSQLWTLQKQVEDAAARAKDLEGQIETARASHLEEILKLKSSHDLQFRELEAEATRTEAMWQDKLRLRDNEMRMTNENHNAQISEARLRIEALEEKGNHLVAQCNEKDAELFEAQELRTRLMTAMGLGNKLKCNQTGQPPVEPRHHRHPQRRFVRLDSEIANEECLTGNDFEQASSYSSSSASTGDPTPKRAKPRKEIKAPREQTRMSLPARAFFPTSMDMSPFKRRPLKDVSVARMNMSPVRAADKLLGKDNTVGRKGYGEAEREKPLEAIMIHFPDQNDPYEDSDLLTSTQVASPGLKSKESDTLDETTAEL